MKNIKVIGLLVGMALLFWQCTDLEEVPLDRLSSTQFGQTPEQVQAVVSGVYSQMNASHDHRKFWFMQEVPTDMGVTPKRGSGWSSDGEQKQKRRTWDANDRFPRDIYQFIATGIGRANIALENIPEEYTAEKAQVRYMRAWFYYVLIDLFGNVPIVTVAIEDPANLAGNQPLAEQRLKVFQFIEEELLATVSDLPESSTYPYPNKAIANATLAKLYLNAEVWSGTARWADCITQCDAVINSGKYSLEPSISDSFGPDNFNSAEIIWAAAKDAAGVNNTEGNIVNQVSLRDIQNELYGGIKSGWGGNAVTKEIYDKYEEDDYRRTLILFGELRDDEGNLVDTVFDLDALEIGDDELSNQQGLRSIKYTPDPNASGAYIGNDVVLIRYADILLSKAECQIRLNGAGAGDALINEVIARNFDDFTAVSGADLDFLSEERAREFAYENFRRQDLIRYGEFIDHEYRFKEVTAEHHNLYPLPQVEIDGNPNLVQNPGY